MFSSDSAGNSVTVTSLWKIERKKGPGNVPDLDFFPQDLEMEKFFAFLDVSIPNMLFKNYSFLFT